MPQKYYRCTQIRHVTKTVDVIADSEEDARTKADAIMLDWPDIDSSHYDTTAKEISEDKFTSND